MACNHTERRAFKLSNDPFFVEKVSDIIGLYLNPPDNALVLCVDEKSQWQALESIQPASPTGLGDVEGVTRDYVRYGTTTLFAALDVASGEVLSQSKPRHQYQEIFFSLEHVNLNVPTGLDIHLACDNDTTHKHPLVRACLARRPRCHLHNRPTHASGSTRLSDVLARSRNRLFAVVP